MEINSSSIEFSIIDYNYFEYNEHQFNNINHGIKTNNDNVVIDK